MSFILIQDTKTPKIAFRITSNFSAVRIHVAKYI
jgi:hypothetical protein